MQQLLLALALAAPVAHSQTYHLSDLAPLGAPVAETGRAVAIDGERAIFGGKERAWIAERGDDGRWKTVFELEQDLAPAFAGYGTAVALDGDRAAVGAPTAEIGVQQYIGRVFIFERQDNDAWKLVDAPSLQLSDPAPGFGTSLALNGDRLAVGAPREVDPISGIDSGVVHVLEREPNGQWTSTAVLGVKDGSSIDRFGASVSIWGSRIAVGAPFHEGDGRAFVFDYQFVPETWEQKAELAGTGATGGTELGASVSLWNANLAVGGPGYDDSLGNRGAVWTFRRQFDNTWDQEARLILDETGPDSNTGASVSLDGDHLLVGVPRRWGQGVPFSGSAALFRRDGVDDWSLLELIEPNQAQAEQEVGTAVALDGGYALLGAAGNPSSSGDAKDRVEAFYAYSVSDDPAPLEFGKGSTACADPPVIACNLPPLVASTDFELVTTGAPKLSAGFGLLGLIGDPNGQDPLGLGVTLHLKLSSVPTSLILPGASDSSGTGRVAAPLPPNANLIGSQLFAQTLWIDPDCGLGAFSLTSSNALEIAIGG